jgi:tetratricopeptide (TPR) repeat protein
LRSQREEEKSMRLRWQFSLAQLFVWVALVAACFSLGKLFRSTGTGVMTVGLGVFTYLAFRRALRRASPTSAPCADLAAREGPRPRASWWWRLTAVLAALAGLWVLGVHLSVAAGVVALYMEGFIEGSAFRLLLWWLGSMAVGVSTAGLARVWMGGTLGRWHGGVFALALGWLMVFAHLAVSDAPRRNMEPHWLLLVAGPEALVGILAVLFLPRWGARAARASALGAAAALGSILFGLLVYTGGTLVDGGYIHVRHLILGVAGAWLAGIGAGIVGALVGAVGDRQDVALPQPVVPEIPSPGKPVAPTRRRWPSLARARRRVVVSATSGLLLFAAVSVILDLRSEHSAIRTSWSPLELSIEHFAGTVANAYWEYRSRMEEDARRRQTNELPPVDRVEVFLLGDAPEAHQPFPRELFPLPDWADEDSYASILRQATVTGAEGEALAQLWRTRERQPEPSSVEFRSPYGLRFYAGRCLILEVAEEYFTDGGLAYPWTFTLRENEPLAVRLQEVIPIPDHDRADLAIALARRCLLEKLYDKAEAEFKRALQLDKNAAGAHVGLGQVLEARGDRKGALGAYDTAQQGSRIGPVNALHVFPPAFQRDDVFYHRGQLHFAMRNYDQGLADVNRAIEHHPFSSPERADCHVLRAAIYLEMGEAHAAIADLDSAIHDSPLNVSAYELRAKAHRAIGKPEAAQMDLENARDARRKSPQQDD